MVKKFIDGPLSTFGSVISTTIKNFVFGKKKEGEDAETGGLLGLIKGIFTAKNISNAISGVLSLMTGFYKMLGKIVLIPFFGTGEWTLMKPKTWGGLLGSIVKIFTETEQADIDNFGMKTDEILGSIGNFLKNIFWHDDGESGLLQKAVKWFQEMMAKFDVVARLKAKGKEITDSLKFWKSDDKKEDIEEKKRQEEEKKKKKEEEKKKKDELKDKGVPWYKKMFGGEEEDKKPLGDIDNYVKPLHKGGGFVMDKNQTRASSLTGQTSDAQAKMAILGTMFSDKVRITSGYRDKDRSNKAMLGSADDMTKYKKKWRDMLTPEQLKSKPGSKERQAAIDTMRAGGFGSQHEHGNAIDFSYPAGFSQDNFSDLKATLLGAFPGAKIVGESDHVHMAFNKKNTGMKLAQMQIDAGTIGRAGGAGAGGSTSNTNSSTTINNGTQIAMTSPIKDGHRETEMQT
tara:strand:- start:46 stop:1416 length:1371 start_codon:yes stop_codon:yes gene_type:complete